jgi:hypothetical protein
MRTTRNTKNVWRLRQENGSNIREPAAPNRDRRHSAEMAAQPLPDESDDMTTDTMLPLPEPVAWLSPPFGDVFPSRTWKPPEGMEWPPKTAVPLYTAAAIDAAWAAARAAGGMTMPERNFGRGDLMAIAAVRYCLGRMSYIVGDCVEWLEEQWPNLSSNARAVIKSDIEAMFQRDDDARQRGEEYKPLGMDCDREGWERVRKLWAN